VEDETGYQCCGSADPGSRQNITAEPDADLVEVRTWIHELGQVREKNISIRDLLVIILK
jgi:hypothetical protein